MSSLIIELARLYNRHVPWARGKTRLAEFAAKRAGLSGTVSYETTFGARLSLDLSQYVQRRIFIDGCYEPNVLRAMEFIARLFPCQTFVDVGSNIGQHAIFAAIKLDPQRIYAFEPYPPTNKRLRENLRLNSLESKVSVLDIALTDHEGTLFINLASKTNDGANYVSDQALNERSVQIRTSTLDMFAAGHDIDQIDLLKIDVEGAELAVLRGANRLLSEQRIGAAIVELCEETLSRADTSISKIVELFHEAGYVGFLLHGRRLKPIEVSGRIKGVQEGIFVPNANAEKLLRLFADAR